MEHYLNDVVVKELIQKAGRILQKSIRILQGCGPSSPTMWSEFSRVGDPNSFPGRVLSYPNTAMTMAMTIMSTFFGIVNKILYSVFQKLDPDDH